MEEITEEPVVEEAAPEAKKESHEELFGRLLGFASVLFFVFLAGIVAWFGYRNIRQGGEAKTSIGDLPKTETPVVAASKPDPTPVPDAPAPQEDKKIAITVLNGGSVKGAATVAQAVIKGEGFPNVTTGNAVKNYTNVTVYYGADADQVSAEAVKTALLKKYKSVTTATSTAEADTKKSAIVVIVGQQ